jgi:hypothetical protein
MDRGHNREPIFADDEDRHAFLNLVGRYQKRFALRIYHWGATPIPTRPIFPRIAGRSVLSWRSVMGLDLSFTVENDGIDICLTQVDSDLLSILGRSWPSEVEAFAGVDEFGAARTENRVSLLQAVQTLLEKLDQEADKLPYLYEHAIIDGPYTGVSGSGRISGIQIGGDGFYYSIEGGLGRCLLKKQGRRPDGWGYNLEVRDIRDMTTI